MVRVHFNKEMPHFFAGLIALGLARAVLFGGQMVVIHLEHSTIPSTTPDLFLLKNQGLAFQRAAARAADVLPIYGSSELLSHAVRGKGKFFFGLRRRVSNFPPLAAEARAHSSCCKK